MTARRIGVISDTHGLLRPQALAALAGCDLIVHAGDIGTAASGPAILARLGTIAPVVAVRGNNDRGAWAEALPEVDTVALGTYRLLVLHDLKTLACDPAAEGLAAVIAGHSHRPDVAWRGPVLHLNPGSAGPRRFRLPVSVATLELDAGRPRARIVELDPEAGQMVP